MANQAHLEESPSGLEPADDGWFVVNVREAAWRTHDAFGSSCRFESDEAWFRELGINLRVLRPGQPNCLYHSESLQEDFLVLSGECLLLIEGEERRLGPWDFVHSPPWTDHIFLGAGDGPCVIMMVGGRSAPWQVRYVVSEVAARHGASVKEETDNPDVAYVG